MILVSIRSNILPLEGLRLYSVVKLLSDMELSQNAIAFSIESLMSTPSKNENHCRSQTSKVDSRVEKGLTKEQYRVCDTKTRDTSLDPLVCRATSFMKQISVEDKTVNTEGTSRLTFPRNGFVVEQATPKWKKTPSYFPGELVNTRIYDPTMVKNSPKGARSHRGDAPFLITKYQRRDHPTSIPNPHGDSRDNEPPWKGKRETGDEETFCSGPVAEQPISKKVNGIRVSLENSTLWRMFNKCGTEMIVNRIGRYFVIIIKDPKHFQFSSHRSFLLLCFLVIYLMFFYLANREISQIIQSMVAKKGLTNRTNVHTPM